MDPDENRAERNQDVHPVDTRSFDEEARREAERVFRRTGGESLEDYLQNINTYLAELNNKLGVQPSEQDGGEADDGGFPAYDAAEPSGPAGDLPPDGPYRPYPDAGRPPYAASPDGPYRSYPDVGRPPYGAPPDGPYRSYPDVGRPPYGAPPDGPYQVLPDADQPPQGAFEGAAMYMESLAPQDGGSNWQAAVPNPELYPDLDDPAVVNPRAARKKSGKREKKEKVPKTTKGGKSRSSFFTTLLNLGLYAGWTVLYFVCLVVRSMMFASAQSQMAAQGVVNYSLSISSPLFTVLKILIYAMPVVILLWMRGVLKADKKELPQVDRRLQIAAFAVDVIAGVIAVYDVLAGQLIFT